ncbi:hypothetical protein B0H14DRAFT_3507867 [Mycena olivaceomarginata]|nr:hypothetical protein B0H14DRAFT_3507867 [Mycena olivaceomarginata]
MSVDERSGANPEYRNITRTKFAYSNENVRKEYDSAGPQYARKAPTLPCAGSPNPSLVNTAHTRTPHHPVTPLPARNTLVTPATQPRAPLHSPASAPGGARAIPRTPTPSALARRPPPAARIRRVVSASSVPTPALFAPSPLCKSAVAASPRLLAVLPSSLPPSHATQRVASPLSHPVQWPLLVQLHVPQKVDPCPSRLECLQHPCAIFSHTIGWSCAWTSAWAQPSFSKSIAGSSVEPFPHQSTLYHNILLTYPAQASQTSIHRLGPRDREYIYEFSAVPW